MLLSEPLRVGPKCSRSSARDNSLLPAEAVFGDRETNQHSTELLVVPEISAALNGSNLGFRSPHQSW